LGIAKVRAWSRLSLNGNGVCPCATGLGSHFILGERFQPQYFVDVALIMIGIVVTVKA
jgi:drug/metabolite transporter (DMT)-like permease